MAGKPGIRNLHGMRGRQKGGLAAPALPPAAGLGTLQELVPRFLQRLETRGYSVATAEMHRWALNQFLGWCDRLDYHDPASLTRGRLEAYQLFLFQYRSPRGGKTLAINTQLARLGCIRRFFTWLCRDGILPANPASDLDLPRKQARALPKSLSPEEIDRLLALPDVTSPFGLRDRTVLELFYSTGVRRTEMTRLEVGDYDPDARTLLVRRGKNGKSRLLPVGGHAAAWLDRYLAGARPLIAFLPAESSLFLSGYGTAFTPAYLGTWVSKQMKRVGITKPGASHLFRHSCATHMHENGADIRHVQEMLGHARLDTTQIYTHVSIKALQEVHARCHPHGGMPEKVPASPPPAVLTACENPEMVITTPAAEIVEVPPPTSARGEDSDRPDDDPPAGGAPVSPTGPKSPSPPKSGSELHINDLSQSPKIQVVYYGYRYYDPVTGRWPARDPLAENGGPNLFGFVGNNGLSRIDGLGLTAYKLGNDDPEVPVDKGMGGAATYGTEAPTLEALAQLPLIHAALNGLEGSLPEAVAHVRHYLGGSGAEYPVNVKKMHNEVPSAQLNFETEYDEAMRFAESLQDGSHSITSSQTTAGYNGQNESLNWFLAVGGYQYWGKGPVTICRGNSNHNRLGGFEFQMTFSFKVSDQYNWNPGQSVFHGLIPDEFLGKFHLMGLAQEFPLRGLRTITLRWNEGGEPEITEGLLPSGTGSVSGGATSQGGSIDSIPFPIPNIVNQPLPGSPVLPGLFPIDGGVGVGIIWNY